MKLPADPGDWTERHLERVEDLLWRAFDKYEKFAGVNEKKADDYYQKYLHYREMAENLRMSLNLKVVLYP